MLTDIKCPHCVGTPPVQREDGMPEIADLRRHRDELLAANNRELERRRAAERELKVRDAEIDAHRLLIRKFIDADVDWRVIGSWLESRVVTWVRSRIGPEFMHPRERAMRLLEEALELAQAEGITANQVADQARHVYDRPAGEVHQEAGGVAVCLLGWCAARDTRLHDVAMREIERIEAKPIAEIRGSLARKRDAGLVVALDARHAKTETK